MTPPLKLTMFPLGAVNDILLNTYNVSIRHG